MSPLNYISVSGLSNCNSCLLIKNVNFILHTFSLFKDIFFYIICNIWFPERPHTITLQSPVNSDNNCFLDAFCHTFILLVLLSRKNVYILRLRCHLSTLITHCFLDVFCRLYILPVLRSRSHISRLRLLSPVNSDNNSLNRFVTPQCYVMSKMSCQFCTVSIP